MQAPKVFRSPVWLLLHKLSLPHYRYIRKMRRGDRLPLTQHVTGLKLNKDFFDYRKYFIHQSGNRN
jgi:hypothetical protein